jgi:hypothetical protein
LGQLETRLTGVVVAALKEAFDRDSRRLDLEHEQVNAERQRAERRCGWNCCVRQATASWRLRLTAVMAVASWIGTLFFSARLIAGGAARGWRSVPVDRACWRPSRCRLPDRPASATRSPASTSTAIRAVPATLAGQLAPWFVVVGLALVGAAALMGCQDVLKTRSSARPSY